MALIPIASQTLGTASTSVIFNSIPTTLQGQTLRDLYVVARVLSSSATIQMRLSGSSSTAYNWVDMNANSSNRFSGNITSSNAQTVFGYTPNTTNTTLITINIIDFAQSGKNKTFLIRSGLGSQGVEAYGARWADTSAVTSIEFMGTTYAVGSTFSLYGVVA